MGGGLLARKEGTDTSVFRPVLSSNVSFRQTISWGSVWVSYTSQKLSILSLRDGGTMFTLSRDV
jgi:hypothetical protein